jgi:hypothetical protein
MKIILKFNHFLVFSTDKKLYYCIILYNLFKKV